MIGTAMRRRAGSYAFLLLMLVAWLIVYPIFDTSGHRSAVIGEIVFAGLLLASVGAASGHRWNMRGLVILATVVVGVSVVYHFDIARGTGVRPW